MSAARKKRLSKRRGCLEILMTGAGVAGIGLASLDAGWYYQQVKKEEALERLIQSSPEGLFRLDLEGQEVDRSEKRVRLDIFIEPGRHDSWYTGEGKERIFRYVKEFYAREGVLLELRFSGTPLKRGSLDDPSRIGLEIVSPSAWSDRNIALGNLKGTLERLMVHFSDTDVVGRAWVDYGCAVILADPGLERLRDSIEEEYLSQTEESLRAEADHLADRLRAQVIAHEIGHLFGLYHSFEFDSDETHDFNAPAVPNMMSYVAGFSRSQLPLGGSLNEVQKKMIHSYLGKGMIYRQMRAARFRWGTWLELIARENRY